MLCYVRLYFPFSLLVVAIRCSCVVVYVVKELIDLKKLTQRLKLNKYVCTK